MAIIENFTMRLSKNCLPVKERITWEATWKIGDIAEYQGTCHRKMPTLDWKQSKVCYFVFIDSKICFAWFDVYDVKRDRKVKGEGYLAPWAEARRETRPCCWGWAASCSRTRCRAESWTNISSSWVRVWCWCNVDADVDVVVQAYRLLGHPCKIGNMRCPGTLKNQNPQFEEKK